MAPPVGIIIVRDAAHKLKWKIGKEVGSGACAAVHLLHDEQQSKTSDCQWVVKLAPLPKKITKAGKSLSEVNANLIDFERQMYQNQFIEYQGDILPHLPSSSSDNPPVTGEQDGFRYFVMERMQAPLWDVVPALLQKASDNDKIDIGPIAERLLTCVELMHARKHLVMDIKAENFMLASNNSQSKAKPTKKRAAKSSTVAVAEALASRLRLLDVALVAPYQPRGGHRPDDGIGEIIGTPLYSSLNVHDLHTPSRRDDVESVGYVIAELIIRIVAASQGDASQYESKNAMPSYLPWSQQSSDQAIGDMKAKEVRNLNSTFYQRMGDKDTAKTMKEFFDRTQAMKYKETPDYDAFRELLSSLVVSADAPPKKKAATATKKKTTARAAAAKKTTTTTTRTTRSKRAVASVPSDDEWESEKEESPQKQQKFAVNNDDDCFVDAAMDVDSDNESVFHDAAEEMEEMDWEPSKENAAEKPKKRIGLTLVITAGPHSGEHFDLLQGEVSSVVIGKNPKSSKPNRLEVLWQLPNDAEVGDTHAKLDLRVTKQSSSIKITDLNSGTTIVNQTTIKKGKDMQAFIGSSFAIGESTFTVKELSKQNQKANASTTTTKEAGKKKTPFVAHYNQASTTRSNVKSAPPKKLDKASKTSSSSKMGPSAILEVVSGPHKGETFALIKDEVEIINVGSASSAAKKGEPVVLAADTRIEKRHAIFKLVVSRKLVKVAVKDLSESGTFVNGTLTAKGKEHMAFINDLIKIGETELVVKLG